MALLMARHEEGELPPVEWPEHRVRRLHDGESKTRPLEEGEELGSSALPARALLREIEPAGGTDSLGSLDLA